VEATVLPSKKTVVIEALYRFFLMKKIFLLFLEEKILCHYVIHEPLKAGFAQPEHQLELTTKDGCSGITWDAQVVAKNGLMDGSRSKNSTFASFEFLLSFLLLSDPFRATSTATNMQE
jgi:hypothetical protein